MAMQLDRIRLSFLFTETLLDLQGAAAGAPLEGLLEEGGYVSTVDTLQAGGAAPLDLVLPWPHPVGHHFWDYYVHAKRPGKADGALCFSKLVPLRALKVADAVDCSLPGGPRVTLEGYYMPYSVGLLLTVELAGAMTVQAAGDLALQVRYGPVFTPVWNGVAAGALRLEQLATQALDRLREQAFGAEAAGTPGQMFSVATILAASGVNPNTAIVTGTPTHRLLNGLSSWVKTWSQLSPPAPQDGVAKLKTRTNSTFPGDMLFAAERGRAVWYPGLFGLPAGTVHSLGCYHRNLAVGSLQVEHLLGLASAIEGRFKGPQMVPNSVQKLGGLVGGLLAQLYKGEKTYCSDSLRAQIAQSQALAEAESLCARLGLPGVAAP